MRDWPPLRLSKALLVLDRRYTQGLFLKMLEQLYAHQPNENVHTKFVQIVWRRLETTELCHH